MKHSIVPLNVLVSFLFYFFELKKVVFSFHPPRPRPPPPQGLEGMRQGRGET